MRKILSAAFLALTALGFAPAPAGASVYSDDLGRCLVSASSDADRILLVKWFFSALSVSPAVRTMSTVTPPQRDALNAGAAELMQRLLLVSCHKQSVDALKYDGPAALEAGFNLLGSVAARGLMSDPAVVASLGGFAAHVDQAKIDALYKEAGISPPPTPK